MVEHKITVGLSSINKKEGNMRGTLPSSGATGPLDYLLSTSEVLDIIIEASSNMLDPLLPKEYVTVGKHIDLSHVNPTLRLTGGAITTIITVTGVANNKIYLDFFCHDDIGLICQGKYERNIVGKEKLMEATYRRAQSKE